MAVKRPWRNGLRPVPGSARLVALRWLLFIAAVGLVILVFRRLPISQPAWAPHATAYGIGAVAALFSLAGCLLGEEG